jgi:hypothetical protein
MKAKISLTLTLSQPLGEGTAAGRFSLRHVIQPASAFNLPEDWERFSLSRRTGEGRGEGFVKTNFDFFV